MEDTLAIIATMTQSADFNGAYEHAVPLAQQYPNAVAAQIAAAYACDRVGNEEKALIYYRKGWALGVPEEHRFQFLIGFSSTLRNVGCAHESLEWLQLARGEQPNNPALAAFTALALHTVGETELALATMLDVEHFIVEMGGRAVADIDWTDGLAARAQLYQCVSNR